MEEIKFYRCSHCGNIITKLHDGGPKVVCCGEEMEELVVNTTDAAHEKHVPVVTRKNNKLVVNVGSVDHPMSEEHYIEFIVLQTETGMRVVYLKPNDKPCCEIYEDEPVVAVYAYCNLHGLWKTSV